MKLLFELSGENSTLPYAEIECVASVIDTRPQVAVAECPVPAAARRLSMTHVVIEYLGECAPDITSFRHMLSDLSIATDQPFAGRAKLIHDGCQKKNPCSQREFERLIGTMITGPVQLINPVEEYRAILSQDRCYFGRGTVPDRSRSIQRAQPGQTRIFPSRGHDATDGTDAR